MMKWLGRAAIILVVIGAGVWAWTYFFPRPEKAIRKRMLALAQAASFGSGESIVSKGLAINELVEMFTDDVEISVDVQGLERATLSSKEDLRAQATIVRNGLRGLSVEFLDITVTLTPNKQSAVVNLTAKIRIPSQKEFFPQELKFSLKKVDGKWLIRRVETVRTLSMRAKTIAGFLA